jgi:hypothetical protein
MHAVHRPVVTVPYQIAERYGTTDQRSAAPACD